MRAAPGALALLVGAGLLSGPWWSSTLPKSDYPLVIVLGAVFAAIGAFAAIPDSWPRLRTLSFALFMGTFGLVCAALTLTPLHPAADGTWTIGGIPGFITGGPIPWWARLVAVSAGRRTVIRAWTPPVSPPVGAVLAPVIPRATA